MDLHTELLKLKELMGTDNKKFTTQLELIRKNFVSLEDKEEIEKFISEGLQEITKEINIIESELLVKKQLKEISDIISLSYISKKYFNKSRQWIYQRVNGYNVNGRPAKFTEKEIETLNFALKDIAKKIGSLNISL